MVYDVAVIGAGILGITTAWELQKRGASVIVFEQAEFASGTSGRATYAWLNATGKTEDYDYHRLNREGMARYAELAEEWGEVALGLSARGGLHWASEAEEPETCGELERSFETLERWGYPIVRLDAFELAAVEPTLKVGPGHRGYLAPLDRWLDTRRFLTFVRQRLIANRGEMRMRSKVLRIDRPKGAGGLVCHTPQGATGVAQVVLTVGAETASLFDSLLEGEPRPTLTVEARPGLLVETPALPPGCLPQHVLHCPDRGGLHVRPTSNGGLLLGSHDADARFVAEGETAIPGIKRELLRRLSRYLTFDATDLSSQSNQVIGIRPVPSDGLPVAGYIQDRVYLLAAHSGVTLGPRLALIVAEEVAERTNHSRLAKYRPFRRDLAA